MNKLLNQGKMKLRDIIDYLDPNELIKIKKDLNSGAIHLRTFVEKKIIENEKKHEEYCAVCSSQIDPNNVNNFTLIFGPYDLKRKATFCAMDCLRYFLNNLEQIRSRHQKISPRLDSSKFEDVD